MLSRPSAQHFRVPLAVPSRAVAGEFVRSDVLVAVAVAVGQPWGLNPPRATRRWIAQRTGLDPRTIRSSLRGNLADLVDETASGAFVWRDLSRFVRVTWADLVALRRRPVFDAVRFACWTWIQLAGVKPWRRVLFSPAEVAVALGWTTREAGRVVRAVEGSADRLGAKAAALVDLVDGWIVSRAPRAGAVDPATCGKPGGKASGSTVDPRSKGSAPPGVPRVRAEDLYIRSSEGSKNLLVDLAARFAVVRATEEGRDAALSVSRPQFAGPGPGEAPDPVRRAVASLCRAEGPTAVLVAFDRYLDRLRGPGKGRGWALATLRRVFDALTGRGSAPLWKGRPWPPGSGAGPPLEGRPVESKR